MQEGYGLGIDLNPVFIITRDGWTVSQFDIKILPVDNGSYLRAQWLTP